MFPPTQPMTGPDSRPYWDQPLAYPPRDLVRGAPRHREPVQTALTSLSPSLVQDLMRFDQGDQQRELLEVLAACIRHTQPLAIDLTWGEQVVTLSVFPVARLVFCPLPMPQFLAGDLAAQQVLQVQPASLEAPDGHAPVSTSSTARHKAFSPLGPLLWAIALHGARGDLLPELAGQAAYRVAPGMGLDGLDIPGAMAACITRLRRQTCNLREISDCVGVGRERAMRLLNALYLQSALIVSRSHPAATNEGWTGYGP